MVYLLLLLFSCISSYLLNVSTYWCFRCWWSQELLPLFQKNKTKIEKKKNLNKLHTDAEMLCVHVAVVCLSTLPSQYWTLYPLLDFCLFIVCVMTFSSAFMRNIEKEQKPICSKKALLICPTDVNGKNRFICSNLLSLCVCVCECVSTKSIQMTIALQVDNTRIYLIKKNENFHSILLIICFSLSFLQIYLQKRSCGRISISLRC